MWEKIARWLFFTILFSLIPLAFAFVKAQALGPVVSLPSLIARGGLLILAAGLSAGAIGDLFLSSKNWLGLKVSAAGFCTVNAVAAALFYVTVSDAYTEALRIGEPIEDHINTQVVFWLSTILYGIAVFASFICVWIDAAEKERTDKTGTNSNAAVAERTDETVTKAEE